MTKQALINDRQRFEHYKASFATLFKYHAGDTDPKLVKAREDIETFLAEWESRLVAQEQAFEEAERLAKAKAKAKAKAQQGRDR